MHACKKMSMMVILLFIILFPAVTLAKTLPTLKEGSKSAAVKTVQKQLITLGYLDQKTKATGYYGAQTTAAVKQFQIINSFPVTGTLDDEQQRYLPNALPPTFIASPANISALALPQMAGPSFESMQRIESMIAYGMQYLGTPYRKGGRGPDGFDCSGFVRYVLMAVDIKAPASAQTQGENEAWRRIDNPNDLRRGDLVFFHTSGRSVAIGHSGIYLGGNEFLHSEPTGGGVIISDVFGVDSAGAPSYYNKNYLLARRVFE